MILTNSKPDEPNGVTSLSGATNTIICTDPARVGHIMAKEETQIRLSNTGIIIMWEKGGGIMFSSAKSIV